jgi:CheY-like chemotaxis protein
MAARILIVEDDIASRELVSYLLESAGYTTVAAKDGESGLRLALASSPDVVICDLQLPRMTGRELVRALRDSTAWQRVPLIAVTALSMPGDREMTLAAGFDGYISKPIKPETFVGEIEAFLPAGQRAGGE